MLYLCMRIPGLYVKIIDVDSQNFLIKFLPCSIISYLLYFHDAVEPVTCIKRPSLYKDHLKIPHMRSLYTNPPV